MRTISTFPEAGLVFQDAVRMFPVDGEVKVLDMMAEGRNWR